MTDTKITIGKVKTVFTTSEPDKVLIQYEDKVTAGNGRKVDFPEGKGKVCMEISAFLFEQLEKVGINTHYLDTFPERIMSCKKVDIIPIEVVVRNVAAGSLCRQTYIEEGVFLYPPLVEFYLKDDSKDDQRHQSNLFNSKIQFKVKDFFKDYWQNHICYEEFPVFGTRMKVDLINFTRKIAVEVQGDQHNQYNKFFHGGSRDKYLASIKSCLLYTSPSPRDRTRSRMPSSA